jgi:hypothetical protein
VKYKDKKFSKPILILTVLLVLGASTIIMIYSLQEPEPQPHESNPIEDDPLLSQKVVSIEKQETSSNTGSHTFYHVNLKGGKQITYDNYKSNHPLCPENPEKCGEDSKEPGWSQVDTLLQKNSFRKEETGTRQKFIPKNNICMKSKTSYTPC